MLQVVLYVVLRSEIDLDFPAMDLLLWQVFGISDFFATWNKKLLGIEDC